MLVRPPEGVNKPGTEEHSHLGTAHSRAARAPSQVSLVSGPLGEPTVLDHEEVSGLFQLEVNFVPVEVDVVGD